MNQPNVHAKTSILKQNNSKPTRENAEKYDNAGGRFASTLVIYTNTGVILHH
jgi:hypothetical protein